LRNDNSGVAHALQPEVRFEDQLVSVATRVQSAMFSGCDQNVPHRSLVGLTPYPPRDKPRHFGSHDSVSAQEQVYKDSKKKLLPMVAIPRLRRPREQCRTQYRTADRLYPTASDHTIVRVRSDSSRGSHPNTAVPLEPRVHRRPPWAHDSRSQHDCCVVSAFKHLNVAQPTMTGFGMPVLPTRVHSAALTLLRLSRPRCSLFVLVRGCPICPNRRTSPLL